VALDALKAEIELADQFWIDEDGGKKFMNCLRCERSDSKAERSGSVHKVNKKEANLASFGMSYAEPLQRPKRRRSLISAKQPSAWTAHAFSTSARSWTPRVSHRPAAFVPQHESCAEEVYWSKRFDGLSSTECSSNHQLQLLGRRSRPSLSCGYSIWNVSSGRSKLISLSTTFEGTSALQ